MKVQSSPSRRKYCESLAKASADKTGAKRLSGNKGLVKLEISRANGEWTSGSVTTFTQMHQEILPKVSIDSRHEGRCRSHGLVEIMPRFSNKSASILFTSENGATRPTRSPAKKRSSKICSTKRTNLPWERTLKTLTATPKPPPPRPLPALPSTIREPTLGLPGAAEHECCVNLAVSSVRTQGPRERGSPFSEGRRRSTDKSSGQLLRRECYPSLDSSRCPCRLLADS